MNTKEEVSKMTEAVKDIEKKEEAVVEESRTYVWARSDVMLKDKHVEVHADMPGVDKDGVDITLHRNILEIKGRRSDYDGLGRKDYRSSFTLGEEVKRDGLKAKIDNGVLTITVPKAKDSALVHIPVKS